MKLNRNYIQTLIFIAVYLFAIYFWTQPLQERGLPYGEYDAMSHFEVADYMAYNDRSFNKLPDYIELRYGTDNKYKPHTLWYPPTFHSSLAVAEVVGGERVVPVFLMNTVLATFILISVYFVINSLFGFLPAILSALLLIFSPRDFMPFLWGQWPERFAYAFVPLILYFFYRYFITYSKEQKPTYLYITALLLGINILIHPLVFFHSAIALIILYILLSIKQKKIVFNLKHISIAAVIFIALFMLFPNQTFNIFAQFSRDSTGNSLQSSFDFSRLFQWSLNPKDYGDSVPAGYFSFGEMHGLWTLLFLLIGIAFVLWRREERDILLLAWLIGLYLVMHRDLIGKATFLHRSLSASAHIFAPLTAIGAIYIASAIRLPPNFNKYLKYGIAGLFIFLVISVNMAYASKILNKDTYNDFFSTLSKEQYLAAEWILENADPQYNVSVVGIPHQQNLLPATAKKIRWSAAVSQHVSRFYLLALAEDKEEAERRLKNDYMMLDYTMLGPIGDKETFDKMQDMEKNDLTNYTLLYNQNNIRVYKLETQ